MSYKIHFYLEDVYLLVDDKILNQHPEGWYYKNKHSSCIYNEKTKRLLVKKLIDNKFLDIEKNIIDGGCRFGDNTLPWSLMINGNVYAIDPAEKNIDIINNLSNLNNIKNIKTFKIGLSDNNDKLYTNGNPIHCVYQNKEKSNIYIPPHGLLHGNPQKHSFIVDSYTIDTLYFDKKIQNISLIHLDIEGFEGPVISKSKETIEKEKPIIIWENHIDIKHKSTDNYEFLVIINFLNDLNYISYMINECSGGNPTCRNFISISNTKINIFEDIIKTEIQNNQIKKII